MPGAFLLPPALMQAPLHSNGGAPHPTSRSDSSWAPSLQLDLTLSPWRGHQTPQAHKAAPPMFLTSLLQVGGSHHPLLGPDSFARAAPRT